MICLIVSHFHRFHEFGHILANLLCETQYQWVSGYVFFSSCLIIIFVIVFLLFFIVFYYFYYCFLLFFIVFYCFLLFFVADTIMGGSCVDMCPPHK